MKRIPSIHPCEILNEEFLKPLGIGQNQLGRDLGVSPRRIDEIVHGKRSLTADTALRLARYFGNSGRSPLQIAFAMKSVHAAWTLRQAGAKA